MFRKTFRFLGRNFFNVKGALGVDELKRSSKELLSMGKRLFCRKKNIKPETFDSAAYRLKLNDQILQERYQSLQTAFYVFSVLAVILGSYSVYLFKDGLINAGILCMAVTILAVLQAFKRHFWLFQIRQKRLGCNFKEWWADLRGK